MRSIDKLKGRWLLVKKWNGTLHYYRGSKKLPTEHFALAYSYPSKEAALKNRRFMRSSCHYWPIPACEKTIFKMKLKGVK